MSTPAESVTPIRSDWGTPAPPHGVVDVVTLRLIAVAVVAGAIAFLSPPAGAAVAVLGLMVALVPSTTRGRRVLRAVGASEGESDVMARLANITDGLCSELGMPRPKLWVMDRIGPNALVSWDRGGHVAVTRNLIQTFSRTEAEAVMAFCLVRLASGEARRTTWLVGPLSIPKPARVGHILDTAAVAATRYPPALSAAIAKAEAQAGPFAPLWFVSSTAAHEDADRRIAYLNDL